MFLLSRLGFDDRSRPPVITIIFRNSGPRKARRVVYTLTAMSIYDQFGIRTIINAKGSSTRVSGGFLAPDVTAAMTEAGQYCVDMAELQARASTVIAEVTGAEAGCVTSGAAAGLLLGTAACVAGLDPSKMGRLPDTRGMKNEVIMVRSQRNFYDHAVRATGVKIVEVGLPDRYAGAGVRDAEAWEIAEAITPNTAAIFYVANGNARPPLPAVIDVARKAAVPVLVDAAAQLPPVSNLKRFINEGADLVAFSGGKAISGPQGSGILCGKHDLIMSAILQNLDLDIDWDLWTPPPFFIDKARLKGLPQHGIGRTCKVGKETIIGLLVALRQFAGETDTARQARFGSITNKLQAATGSLRHATVVVQDGTTPRMVITVQPSAPATAREICLALQTGNPPIQADPSRVDQGQIGFNPTCLRPEDPERIARRLRELLG
jgi:D-glucosaminate-6-phosphate ammonia-lyase